MAAVSSANDAADCAGFLAGVETAWSPGLWRDVNVVVAVSGGSDSVSLLRTLVELRAGRPGRGRLTVAHYDHRNAPIRRPMPSGSGSSPIGCRSSTRAAPLSRRRSEARRSCEANVTLSSATSSRRPARVISLRGHTADDLVETVLFRLFRGTGLDGPGRDRVLEARSGIPPRLSVPFFMRARQGAVEYLISQGQPYLTDPSNASTKPTRNWIRHELLPTLEGRFGPGVRDGRSEAVPRRRRRATACFTESPRRRSIGSWFLRRRSMGGSRCGRAILAIWSPPLRSRRFGSRGVGPSCQSAR